MTDDEKVVENLMQHASSAVENVHPPTGNDYSYAHYLLLKAICFTLLDIASILRENGTK